MSPHMAFFVGLGVLTAVSLGVLVLVYRPFTAVLRALCGEEDRARFWTQLYGATVVLTVMFTTMLFPPAPGVENRVDLYGFLVMFRAGVFGLLAALLRCSCSPS